MVRKMEEGWLLKYLRPLLEKLKDKNNDDAGLEEMLMKRPDEYFARVFKDCINVCFGRFGQEQMSKLNDSPMHANAFKSSLWVETLAFSLRREYGKISDDIRVFSKHHHNDEFKKQEFLYDVHAVKISRLEKLPYISESLWQIESEVEKVVSNDGRLSAKSADLMWDVSKLLVGNSNNALFISTDKNDVVRDAMRKMVKGRCDERRIFHAVIKHPNEWNRDSVLRISKI